MILTPHFTLAEMCRSRTAEAQGIVNAPTPGQIENLRALCVTVLEPLRARLDRPLIVSSGFRCVELNAIVGGVPDSRHLDGEAADIHAPGVPMSRLRDTILGIGVVFDELLLEHHDPDEPFSGWVHVSYRRPPRPNRRMSLDVYRPKRK